eukprot:gene7515-15376_t
MKNKPISSRKEVRCDICKKVEINHKLMMTVCDCYKKHEDRGRAHENCIILLVSEKDPESGIPKFINANSNITVTSS